MFGGEATGETGWVAAYGSREGGNEEARRVSKVERRQSKPVRDTVACQLCPGLHPMWGLAKPNESGPSTQDTTERIVGHEANAPMDISNTRLLVGLARVRD